MPRRRRHLLSILAAGAAMAVAAAGLQSGAAQAKPKPAKPTKVVIIVVDALSKEIVDKYDMQNVQGLMADYVDTPKGYLGHTGSVTVVTHNVITSGLLPKHMGWTNEGYRDVDNVLPDVKAGTPATTSSSPATGTRPRCSRCRTTTATRSWPTTSTTTGSRFTISPKVYAAYAFGGRRPTSIITFGSAPACRPAWRQPRRCAARPASTCRRLHQPRVRQPATRERDVYDTDKLPASLYPARRRPLRRPATTPAHEGGDIWATDAALAIMDNERLERHLRDSPGRRQGGAHVGRGQRPGSRPAPTATR